MRNLVIHSRAVSLFACVAAAASCSGTIEDYGGSNEDPTSVTGGTGGGVGKDGVLHPPASAPPSPDTGLRRLTRTEYSNTIRDLFGDPTLSGSALDADRTFAGTGFDNNADMLNQALPAIDQYTSVASDVVDRAFKAGSASRAKLVTCDLAGASGMTCARSVVAAFAHRAWRRPVDGPEIDALMTSALAAQADGMEEVVKSAFQMMLVSPNFLYRVEDSSRDGAGPRRLGPHELATRMSYFVWSSTPDDRLLKAADDLTIADPKVFASELDRMLADHKADALAGNFAAQWLQSLVDAGGQTLRVAELSPDATLFKVWSDSLKKAVTAETRLFFQAFLQGDHRDRSITEMMYTDFSYANDASSHFYGLPFLTGAAMQQVKLTGDQRFGLLSQAGILALTSNVNRTVPTRRGKFVLSKLLCSPPGEPPADIPPLDAAKVRANASVRERLEAHKSQGKSCVACHTVMDPIGLGLEHYDAIGRWRADYGKGTTMDVTGVLPGEITFDGARNLSQILKDDPRFPQCVAQTLFAYTLGRDPSKSEGDRAAIDQVAMVLAGRGGRMRDLVSLIAATSAFQFRGGSR